MATCSLRDCSDDVSGDRKRLRAACESQHGAGCDGERQQQPGRYGHSATCGEYL